MDFEFTEVESLDKVPEQFRPIYAETEEGKYAPSEDYKGVVEAVTGLNKSLKAARAEAKNKKEVDLSPLQDFGQDPSEIKQNIDSKMKELQDELAKGGDAKLNLEKVREELAQGHKKELEKYQTRAEALQNQLYRQLGENEARSSIVDLKGDPELLMPFVLQQLKPVEEDGEYKVYVVDAAGDRRYSGVTGQPMTPKELVAEMKANEKYGRLFESEAPAGGGMPPGSGNRAPAPKGKTLSANEKIAAGLNKGTYKRR